jgi:hypothetical protein
MNDNVKMNDLSGAQGNQIQSFETIERRSIKVLNNNRHLLINLRVFLSTRENITAEKGKTVMVLPSLEG